VVTFNGRSAAEWYSLYCQAVVSQLKEAAMSAEKSRYWLFAGDCHYASGGMHDFRGAFESSELAQQHTFSEWWHVYDIVDGKCVASSERQPFNAPAGPPK